MAGHRQRKLKLTGALPPRRSPGRRSAERMGTAATPEDRLAAAFDAFRFAMARLDRAQAASAAAQATDFLLGMATRMEAARP